MSKLSRQLKHKNEVHNAKNFLLIGAPNVGKSTIFNRLTNATSLVSNIDRMTTEHTVGKIKKTKDLSYLIDLPGVYNLSHPIAEEYETSYHLIHGQVDGIVNVISAFSIERDLYLTLQCIETGLLNTLTINMIDLINTKQIDWDKLSKKLNGVNIVLTRSNRNRNVKLITKSISNNKHVKDNVITYSTKIEKAIDDIERVLPDKLVVSKRFVALMVLEKNDYFINQIKHHYPDCAKQLDKVIKQYKDFDCIEEIRNTKNEFVQYLLRNCGFKSKNYLKVDMTKQQKFDHWFLKKWIGIPLFIIIALAIYYLAFGNYAGGWLTQKFGEWLTTQNPDWKGPAYGLYLLFNNVFHAPQWCTSFFVEGVWGGIAIILPFVITITILYTCITIIQQVGMLSRVSVLLDNALSKFGLSGRSVVNLLTGFGCSVPALMLARSSSSKKERIISVLIVPFCACTTRVIVLSAVSNAVFGNLAWLVTFSLVFFSGLLALLIGLTFSKTMFRKQKSFFCVEMVNWNGLDIRVIAKSVWLQLKEFLKKAFLIVLISNVIIWILVHVGPKGYVGSGLFSGFNIEGSLLRYIGHGLGYLMYPIFGGVNWKLTASLVAGLPAKEITLTTLIQVAEGGKIATLFATKYLALSYLVFMLFYLPCLPSMNTIRSEVGIKNMFMNLGVSFATAYVLATLTYWIGYGISLI